MWTKRLLAQQSDELLDLRAFIEVYEEVAATRMQRVRADVVRARDFLDGLTDLFAEVKFNYNAQVGQIVAKSKQAKNNRTVAVFISANSGLYGDIVERTFETFLSFLADTKTDVVIVGKLGLRMLRERKPEVLYNYFDFDDDKVETDSLGLIMRYLLQFEKVVVFYGKFKNILNQDPVSVDLSGNQVLQESESRRTTNQRNQYLFEPSLADILQVFEGEILSSIFEQVVHESHLAKFAARLQHLDRSIENIDGQMTNLRLENRRVKHRTENRKQLTRLSGLWLREGVYG